MPVTPPLPPLKPFSPTMTPAPPPPSNYDAWHPFPTPLFYHPQTSPLPPGLSADTLPDPPTSPTPSLQPWRIVAAPAPTLSLPWVSCGPETPCSHLPPFLQSDKAIDVLHLLPSMPVAMPIHCLASALYLPSLNQASASACILVSAYPCCAAGLMLCTSRIDIFPYRSVNLLQLSYRYLPSQP